jgi:hypothetical protein
VSVPVTAAWRITLFWLLGSSVAIAAPPRLHALTEEYAQKNQLPIRVVKNDLGTREIEREFVPVLPTTHQSFVEHFQADHGAVIWRSGAHDLVHVTLGVRPKELMHHLSARGEGHLFRMGHEMGGRYLTLALDRAEVAHLEQFIDRYTPPGRPLYKDAVTDGGYAKFVEAMQKQGNPVYGGCMWWLVNTEISPGLNLATAMGVRRAKGPESLAPRLVHAGNERVGPIGVAVKSIEEFNQMTDEQLMGPEPAGGATEQVKE